MNPENELLLQRLISSEIKTELLTLFHRNPGLVDTITGIALRIGRSDAEVGGDVKDFVELGLLTKRTLGKTKMEVIQLNPSRDREIQASLEKYFSGLRGESR
jgi:predicted transcriptional regulator